jgi:spore germination protein PC
MSQDIYRYIQELQIYIQHQDRRIQRLEKDVKELQKQFGEIKERPPIRVDKIEYKFDQLKVESLEGTLNIGLNPSDLQGIDEFNVDQQTIQTPKLSPKDFMQRSMEVEEEINQFLESELPSIYQQSQQKLNINVDDSYLSFIKEDIKKQLPSRVQYYIKQNGTEERTRQEGKDNIVEQLKKEIQNGVLTFLSHLPDNVKGMSNQ